MPWQKQILPFQNSELLPVASSSVSVWLPRLNENCVLKTKPVKDKRWKSMGSKLNSSAINYWWRAEWVWEEGKRPSTAQTKSHAGARTTSWTDTAAGASQLWRARIFFQSQQVFTQRRLGHVSLSSAVQLISDLKQLKIEMFSMHGCTKTAMACPRPIIIASISCFALKWLYLGDVCIQIKELTRSRD